MHAQKSADAPASPSLNPSKGCRHQRAICQQNSWEKHGEIMPTKFLEKQVAPAAPSLKSCPQYRANCQENSREKHDEIMRKQVWEAGAPRPSSQPASRMLSHAGSKKQNLYKQSASVCLPLQFYSHWYAHTLLQRKTAASSCRLSFSYTSEDKIEP